MSKAFVDSGRGNAGLFHQPSCCGDGMRHKRDALEGWMRSSGPARLSYLDPDWTDLQALGMFPWLVPPWR